MNVLAIKTQHVAQMMEAVNLDTFDGSFIQTEDPQERQAGSRNRENCSPLYPSRRKVLKF